MLTLKDLEKSINHINPRNETTYQCSRIVCVDNKPKEPWKLFFGDNGHFLRDDERYFKKFRNLWDNAFTAIWSWKKFEELYGKDRKRWSDLPDRAKRIFLLNNAYQSLMDSGVVNIYNDLVKITTNTELAINYQLIAFMEGIHANSYSNGLFQMFGSEAEEKINVVYEDPVVKQRLAMEVSYEDEFFRYVVADKNTDDYAKLLVLKVIASTYLLEHIKFPFSFFTTWRINKGYHDALPTFSLLLLEISHDELTHHAPTNANVLKTLRKEKRQGFSHLFEDGFDEFFIKLAQYIAEQEFKWNEYLMQDGDIDGLTKEMGDHFIRYYTDLAVKRIGYDPIFKEPSSDIIAWYEDFRNTNKRNIAAQETENVNYQRGVFVNDINEDKLAELREMYLS